MEPPVAPRRGGRLRHAVVAAVDHPRLGRPDHQLADLVGAERFIVIVDDADLVARPSAADLAAARRVRELEAVRRERRADLGHPVAGADVDTEPRLELLDLRDERTHHHVAQRRVGVVGLLRLHEEERRHRTDEPGAGDAEAAHVVPEVLDRELLPDHHAGAEHRSLVQHRLPRDVERRVHGVEALAREDEVLRRGRHERPERPPRHQDALRRTRRARGVDDRRDVPVVRPGEVVRGHRVGEQLRAGDDAARQTRRRHVGIGNDDRRQLRELRRDVDQLRDEPLADDERGRGRVVDEVPEHLPAVHVVRGHLGRSEPRETEPRVERLEGVREHRHHVLPGLHADPPECIRPPEVRLVQLAARHLAPVDVLHRDGVGLFGGETREQVRQHAVSVEHRRLPPRSAGTSGRMLAIVHAG